MLTLNRLLKKKENESIDSDIKFTRRPYQIAAARKAFEAISNGKNSILDLPTGAGKTNVAILIAIILKLSGKSAFKVLYIVPNRILIDQVARASTWADPELIRVGITDKVSANYFVRWKLMFNSDIIIATPAKIASIFHRNEEEKRQLMRTVGVVIIDEFDEFLMIEPNAFKFTARIEDSLNSLLAVLPRKPFVLMSGTVPKAAEDSHYSSTSRLFYDLVENRFKPTLISTAVKKLSRFLPQAHVHILPVEDAYVKACETALNYKTSKLIQEYECNKRSALDWEYLMPRLELVTSEIMRYVRLSGGRRIPVDTDLKDLCHRLVKVRGQYAFLYEDLFKDVTPDPVTVPLIEDCIPVGVFRTYLLDDKRQEGKYFPQLKKKYESLLRIIRQFKDKKGIVFVRNIELSEALSDAFGSDGIRSVKVDSRVSGSKRYDVVKGFLASQVTNVLLITRTTGKRGLDIPQADYAVLYSPKEDEYVVWQELSRIRSTLSVTKPSIILAYWDTTEFKRLVRLIHDMDNSTNRYEFSINKNFSEKASETFKLTKKLKPVGNLQELFDDHKILRVDLK